MGDPIYRGENDEAFQWLNTSYEANDPVLIMIKPDPLMVGLHDDPHWDAFMERIGLVY